MGRELRTALTTFYYKNKNLHVQIVDPLAGGSRYENAGGVEGYGIEFEATLRPVEGLTIGGALNYLHTEFFDYENAFQVCTDTNRGLVFCLPGPKTNLNGVRAPHAPKYQASLNASYDFPIGSWSGNVAGVVQYRSSFDFVANARGSDVGFERQKGYTVANLSGYVSPPSGGLRLGFYIDNALDKKYAVIRTTNQPYGLSYQAARPRTYGARVEYRF